MPMYLGRMKMKVESRTVHTVVFERKYTTTIEETRIE